MTAYRRNHSTTATAAHTAMAMATRRPVLSSRDNIGLQPHPRRNSEWHGGDRAGGAPSHPQPPALPNPFYAQSGFIDWLPFIVSAALALGIIVAILATAFKNASPSMGTPDRPALTHTSTAPGGLFARPGLGDEPRGENHPPVATAVKRSH